MLPTNPLLNATALAGPHLPVALLRQYAAGTLAPAAQHRVEAHTLACTRCADILEGLLQTPATTTDQAVAQLQQRLRQRVQQAAPTRQGQRLATRRPRWQSLQLAAAAALLLSMVAGGWWAWRQRQAAAQAPMAVATTSALPATEPVVTPPLSSPAPPPAPEALRAPATAQPSAPLAHPGARRSHRRAAAPRPATLPQATQPETPTSTAATSVPPSLEVAPSTASSQPLHLPDSTSLAGTAKPQVGHSFATDPTLVRDAKMPAARRIAPMPTGGMASFRDKLRHEAAEFVPEAPERRLSGTVQLRLTIGADGKLESISVLRGLRADYDAEAQRLVCDGPVWVPGISGGRRAALQVDVAVPF